MKPIVLFRDELATEDEHSVVKRHLPVTSYRSSVPDNSLVVGRYSVLPFYRELEKELDQRGSSLINTFEEHSFIADATQWACGDGPLVGLTPKSWTTWWDLPADKSFVVKGRTNSRKQFWNTHMFAPTRETVSTIARRLLDDGMIAEQGLVVREFVPLKQIGEGLNGLPISNEHRTFWLAQDDGGFRCGGRLLASGFYWQGSHPELSSDACLTPAGLAIAQRAATLMAPFATFFVLDVAETATGDWIVIEVNDGQMSGLSACDPDELYSNLAQCLR